MPEPRPVAEPRIESLLSARLFVAPQLWNNRIYFISNMSGRFSFYAMPHGGGVPEPLLPPDIALQNPELLESYSFNVFPRLGQILVTIDNNGDEKYQPMLVPIEGGFPRPAFPQLQGTQVFTYPVDEDTNTVYLNAPSLTEPITRLYRGNVESGKTDLLFESGWGAFCQAANEDN